MFWRLIRNLFFPAGGKITAHSDLWPDWSDGYGGVVVKRKPQRENSDV